MQGLCDEKANSANIFVAMLIALLGAARDSHHLPDPASKTQSPGGYAIF